MDEEILEYEKYLLNFGMVEKPIMPNFNVLAYTDNEYLNAINELIFDYEKFDDEYLTMQHLLGE